ncbi:S-ADENOSYLMETHIONINE-DEPEND ENT METHYLTRANSFERASE RELATED protein, putative [Babesia bigemina]|uniref:Trimethylguanosine synthase n=1 Tax=Babesia bigemina TaxID=5866 RepID=A0A061D2Z8_BABBI|nr:S-ADENOSYLMETHIONINE-DEPEND ENT METHYLTRANSFERASE RELATED protein, putative [Babesia bigemina]CDR94472.1 S-ADENOSYLMETHIONINE-DEPEND ENT METHYLTRANSFERASE RELATED protein, putative [Babesia bigemina]|eukprot:XP_012766658.1 S-ADENOSYLMETHIONINE-DEPEND ENT METHYLTRANSFERASE RELATED protein, putative [Babesia bigemina]
MTEGSASPKERHDQVPPPRGIFSIRADALTPGVLYLASGADADGRVSSAFLHVIEKHLSYVNPANQQKGAAEDDDAWEDICRSAIFWRQSNDLQYDEDAYVDASWAAESIEVSREIKELLNTEKPPEDSPDNDIVNANGDHVQSSRVRILDLAAGIGGNSVHFGEDSDLVVGVEMNPQRVEICKNNLRAYGVDHACVVQGDLFDFIEQFAEDPMKKAHELGIQQHFTESQHFDCVHTSPPWGGKNYAGSSNDKVYTLQPNFDVERVMKSVAKFTDIATFYLPRSQCVYELVKLADMGGFPLVIISAYHYRRKTRCIHAHFVKRVECFKYLKVENMERTHVPYKKAPHGLNLLVHSTPYVTSKFSIKSDMHMDRVVHAIMKMLDEKTFIVAAKLHNLLRLHPLSGVMAIANQAREIQNAGGMTKTDSNEKRTTGGIFFHLLKTQDRELYKKMEKFV